MIERLCGRGGVSGGQRSVRFRLHRDHLYIEAAAFGANMQDWRTAALLREGDDLHVMPLIGPDAGGYLIKQINARGDRAIHAADFFGCTASTRHARFSARANGAGRPEASW